MVNIRQAEARDLLDMQTTNLWCLPENYQVSGSSQVSTRVDNRKYILCISI